MHNSIYNISLRCYYYNKTYHNIPVDREGEIMEANEKVMVETEELKATGRKWVEQKRLELRARENDLEKLFQECEYLRRDIELMEAWLAVDAEEERVEKDDTGAEAAGSKSPVRLKRGFASDLVESSLDKSVDEKGMELKGDNLRDEVVKILAESYPQGVYYRDVLGRLQKKG
ncbi:MAG: hypothetical protein PHG06_22640, partial [Parabacteroides sp.]|nr:hypothetical protein [Parabacteroides sp.]